MTEIISGRGHSGPNGWGERGTAVHAYCAALDLGQRLPPVQEAWQGYVDGYFECVGSWEAVWQHVEVPFRHPGLKFRGTPDRVGWLYGVPAVVDIKTGSRAAWHGVQLAAYDLLVPAPAPRQRWVVYLPGDGTFRLEQYDDPDDYGTFLHALQNWHAGH